MNNPTAVKSINQIGIASIGLGTFLAWMASLLNFGGVVSGGSLELRSLLDPFSASATLSTAICTLIIYLPLSNLLRRFGKKSLLLLLIPLLALDICATFLLGVFLTSEVVVSYALGVFVGFTIAVFLLQWFALLADYDPKTAIIIFIGSIAVVFISLLLVHLCRKVIGNPWLTSSVASLLLITSFLSLVIYRNYLHPIEIEITEPTFSISKIVALSFVVSMVSQFLWSLNTKERSGDTLPLPSFLLSEASFIVCGIAISTVFLILWRTSKRTSIVVLTLHRVMFLCLIVAIALAIAQDHLPFAARTSAILSFFFTQVGIWSLILHAGYLFDRSPISFMGYVVSAQFFGYFFSCILYNGISSYLVEYPLVSVLLLLFFLAITSVGFLFIFTEEDTRRISRISYSETSQGLSIENQCAVIKSRYSLTNRETDVLELLARGRNAISIQEILHISYSTVKAHKHSIYTKLDIHSHQELLTFIDKNARDIH